MKNRAVIPVLLTGLMFLLAALACNFPGTSGAAADITQTVAALASITAAKVSTSGAGNDILFQTQTAAVPTATPQPSATNTEPPTDTPDPAAATNTPSGPPTQTSIAKESLKVGVEAIVRTGGDVLRLRDNPTTSGRQVASLPGDSRVKIIGGPKAADGFLWWQVNVLTSSASGAAGKTGWVSEQAAGRQTIEVAR
jgi:hypothetical protein